MQNRRPDDLAAAGCRQQRGTGIAAERSCCRCEYQADIGQKPLLFYWTFYSFSTKDPRQCVLKEFRATLDFGPAEEARQVYRAIEDRLTRALGSGSIVTVPLETSFREGLKWAQKDAEIQLYIQQSLLDDRPQLIALHRTY